MTPNSYVLGEIVLTKSVVMVVSVPADCANHRLSDAFVNVCIDQDHEIRSADHVLYYNVGGNGTSVMIITRGRY
jgi:hypothetical protein